MVSIETVTIAAGGGGGGGCVSVVAAFEGVSTTSHGTREPWAVDSLRNAIVSGVLLKAHVFEKKRSDRDRGIIGVWGD